MAGVAWSLCFVFISICLFTPCQGGCGAAIKENEMVRVCEDNTPIVTASSVYLDLNATLQAYEVCACTITHTMTENIEISPLIGSIIEDPCMTRVRVFEVASETTYENIQFQNEIYEMYCHQDQGRSKLVPYANMLQIFVSGAGRLNMCINVASSQQGSQGQGSQLTLQCTRKRLTQSTTPSSTTTPSPTTKAPTTKAPTTKAPTTKAPTTKAPTTASPPTTKTQAPSTKGPTTQKPTTPSTQSPPTVDPSASTEKEKPTTKPTEPTPKSTSEKPKPTTKPTKPTTEAPTTKPDTTVETSPPMASPIVRLPVAEIAGGVGGGIILIILLVILVTCCTGRKQEKRSDEEMLRGRESPDMIETKQEGFAFDNMLYHTTHAGNTGKSVTPTVSDADSHVQDEQATKGLEELYATVNKTITDSTDIM